MTLRWVSIVAAACSAQLAQAVPTVYFAEDTSTTQTVTGSTSAAKRSKFLSGPLIGVGNERFGRAPDRVRPGVAPLTLNFPGASTANLNGAGLRPANEPLCVLPPTVEIRVVASSQRSDLGR
ncbi:MAG: hypothetical protein IPN37_11860 [Betaproteobacteria bacterium]|nr:hypothetical protein [Betaproteobacteria bacterium]